MKHLILSLLISLALAGCRDDSDQTQQQQLQQAQAQLAEQTAKTGTAQGIAALLGVGCIVFLLIGASAGSKTRRAFKDGPDK